MKWRWRRRGSPSLSSLCILLLARMTYAQDEDIPISDANSVEDGLQYDRTTTEIPRVQLNDWIENNPILKQLPMFSGVQVDAMQDITYTGTTKTAKDQPLKNSQQEASNSNSHGFKWQIPRPEDNNFHWQYEEVNRTLFTQTDRPDDDRLEPISMKPHRRFPAGRALSDKTNINGDKLSFGFRDITFNRTAYDTTTEVMPFEVTDALVADLESAWGASDEVPVSTTPSPRATEIPFTERSRGTTAGFITSTFYLPSETVPQRPPFYRIPDQVASRSVVDITSHQDESSSSYGGVNINTVDEFAPFTGDGNMFQLTTARPSPSSLPTTASPRASRHPPIAPPRAHLPEERGFAPEPAVQSTRHTFIEKAMQPSWIGSGFSTAQTVAYFTQHHRFFSTTPLPRAQKTKEGKKRIKQTDGDKWNEHWPSTPIDELVVFSDSSRTTPADLLWDFTTPTSTLAPLPHERSRIQSSRALGGDAPLRSRISHQATSRVPRVTLAGPPYNTTQRVSGRNPYRHVPQYEISATRYYEDDRISAGTKENAKKRHKKKMKHRTQGRSGRTKKERVRAVEWEEIPVNRGWGRTGDPWGADYDDRRYALEREVARTRQLSETLRKRGTNPMGRKKALLAKARRKKYGRTATHSGDVGLPLSQAHMVPRGGRMVEQRVSMIGGQMVTVDLANPLLHGADLMQSPGAIIHENLDGHGQREEERREEERRDESEGRMWTPVPTSSAIDRENERLASINAAEEALQSMNGQSTPLRVLPTETVDLQWANNDSEDRAVGLKTRPHRIYSDGRDATRMEVETFDSSRFDKPSKCCDEKGKLKSGGQREKEEEEGGNVAVPLNSNRPRHTHTGIYSEVNEVALANGESPETRYVVRECFTERRNCYLIDASPLERRIGLSALECLRLCASAPSCLSISYATSLSICDLYNTRNGTENASLVKLLGYCGKYMYYEPRARSLSRCIALSSSRFKSMNPQRLEGVKQQPIEVASNILQVADSPPPSPSLADSLPPSPSLLNSESAYPPRKAFLSSSSSSSSSSLAHDPHPGSHSDLATEAILSKRSTHNLTMALKARCGPGEETIFVRSKGVRDEGGSNLDTVLNINEDDCVFSCISNLAGYYDAFECVTAQYDSYSEACTLSSDPPRDDRLSLHAPSNFYEKICTKGSVSTRCSGGTVDRRRQKVLRGRLQDTITVASAMECIERCVDTENRLSFRCLSVLFYYEESSYNCVLNDGSALTHPSSLTGEKFTVVDYFGVDECHGIKEIRHVVDTRRNELRPYLHDGGVVRARGSKRREDNQLQSLRWRN